MSEEKEEGRTETADTVPDTAPGIIPGTGHVMAQQSRNSRIQPLLRVLPPLLFLGTVVGEVLTLMVMAMYRYDNQGLDPEFFDLGKTANLLSLLLEAPFILLFVMLLLLRRFHRLPLSVMAVAFSFLGLAVLAYAPRLQTTGGYTGYLIFLTVKALELGAFTAVLRMPARTFPRRLADTVLIAVATVLGVFAAVVATVLISPFGSSITDQPRKEYDAGVILGAAVWSRDKPSPVLRERINKGYDLLAGETVQFLVLTGGNAPNEMAEADVARRELLKRGVDPTRIVSETSTSSTLQQILFIRDQLQRKQDWHSFVIISDQFHLKRALEICQFNEIEAVGVSSESPLGPQNLALYHLRESGALILYWLFGE